jgi:hypothetical protein
MELNRFKELCCVIFGHDWSQTGSTTDQESGIVLSSFKQCGSCGVRMVDETGYLRHIKWQQGKQ